MLILKLIRFSFSSRCLKFSSLGLVVLRSVWLNSRLRLAVSGCKPVVAIVFEVTMLGRGVGGSLTLIFVLLGGSTMRLWRTAVE